MGRFDGSVAVVTGGGSGIGQASARGFAREGARVAVLDLRPERSEASAQAIRAEGGTAIGIAADVADPEQVETAVRRTVGELGLPSILVNSVAAYPRKTFLNHSLEEWRRTIDACFFSYVVCMRACVPLMRERGGGKIVNIASVAGHVGFGFPAYTAAKGAILALSRELAAELAPHRININTVSPGVIQTGLNVDSLGDPEIRARSIELTPWGRLGQPEDVAAVVLFLASPEADFVTGADFVVDGGIISTVPMGEKFKSFHAIPRAR